jgi:hypothetical protein
VWINVGICGAHNLPLGSTFVVNKVMCKEVKEALYPPQILQAEFSAKAVITKHMADTSYEDDALIDMEAYAFFKTVWQFTYSELVQSVKIVSDNRKTGIGHVDKHYVTELLADKSQAVSRLAEGLEDLLNNITNPLSSEMEKTTITSNWRFSNTQEKQLDKLLMRIDALGGRIDVESELRPLKTSKEVIRFLEDKADSLPLYF